MSRSKAKNPPNSVDQVDIVEAARAYLDELPKNEAIDAAIAEGREIAAEVEGLGLPRELTAAVHIYPLFRDQNLEINSLENSKLDSLSRLTGDLIQLGRFSLPKNWRPGEALAEQQSEALRKMLLAVVEDVRLVIVRIAEQLCKLRAAKNQPSAVQIHQAFGELNQFFQMQVFRPHSNPSQNESLDSHYDRSRSRSNNVPSFNPLSGWNLHSSGKVGMVVALYFWCSWEEEDNC